MVKNRIPGVIAAYAGQKLMVLGNEIEIKLACAQTGGALFVFENTTPPGDGVPPHVHEHEDEVIRVLEGEYEILLDGKAYTATAGAVINFPRSIMHGFRNIGSSPARSLFIVTPGENFECFLRELGSIAPTIPADMRKVTEVFARYGLPIALSAPELASAAS